MKFRTFTLLAGGALLAAIPATAFAQQTVKAGIAAWQKGDYAGAVAIWRPLAEKGDADAEFNMGQAYRLGRGVPVDLAQAEVWLEKAARAGHMDAQTTLGLLLWDSGDRSGSLQWLKKAAQQGEPRAMLVYGTALFNGDGVPRDPVAAYAYVSRSAAQGLAPAKDTLQQMDQNLPIDVRQKGVKLAMEQAKAAPEPTSKPVSKASAKPKPAKTETAETKKPAPASAKAAESAPEPTAAKTEPKPAAKAAEGGSGGWRIQLGAFSKRSSAEALYGKLSGSLGGREAFYMAAGSVTRLQVGPYSSRAAASAACASLKGHACFPVVAK